MDKDKNMSNKKTLCSASGRCTKPDKCIHLHCQRQQQIGQKCASESQKRPPTCRRNDIDEDVFHDCISISDPDFPKEGHSCKGFYSCQSGVTNKPKSESCCNDNASCNTNSNKNYIDPVVFRKVLTRANNVTEMLLKNFESQDKKSCSATLEITARLVPDPQTSRSNCQLQGRPITVKMPLKFDPNTCQMVTCTASCPTNEEPPKSTGFPALMYMQDERSHPQINDDASPSSNSRNVQTNLSFLLKTRSDVNNKDASSETAFDQSLQPDDKPKSATKILQTDKSHLYDNRSRQAHNQSQTNLKQDLHAMGNIRYPTHFVRPLHDDSCPAKCNTEQWPQSKSQPRIPSKINLQSTGLYTVPETCYSTKSAPNISMRSDISKPSCDDDNATVYFSLASETAPKDTSNVVNLAIPSYSTAQKISLHQAVAQPCNNAANASKDINTVVCSSLPSYHTAQSTSMHPVVKQSTNNVTIFESLEPSVNASAGPDCMKSCDTTQHTTQELLNPPCALPSSSRYFALHSDSGENEKDKNTPCHSMKIGECRFNFQPNGAESEDTNWRLGYFDHCTSGPSLTNEPILTSLPTIIYCPNRQTQLIEEEKGFSRCQKKAPPEIAEESCCFNDVDTSIIMTSVKSGGTGPSRSHINARGEGAISKGSYYDADKSTIVTSVKSCEPYVSEESDCDGLMPINKSSFNCVDKTSSRSQSVMAKITCLCSPEEKAKLGMMGRGVDAEPPFVRVKERPMECCIVTADPSLVSRTTEEAEKGNEAAVTEVVYRREWFCDCLSKSKTSTNVKTYQENPTTGKVSHTLTKDQEASQASCYKSAIKQSTQALASSYKSLGSHACDKKFSTLLTQVSHTLPKDQDVEASQASCYKSAIKQSTQALASSYKSLESHACDKKFSSALTEFKSVHSNAISKCGVSMQSNLLKPESVGVVMDCANRVCFVANDEKQQPETIGGISSDYCDCLVSGNEEHQQTLNQGSIGNTETCYNSCASSTERIAPILDTTCKNRICLAEGAKEQQQTLNERELENAVTGYNSCVSENDSPLLSNECILTCDNRTCLAIGSKEQQQNLSLEKEVTRYNSCASDCGRSLSPKERIVAMLDTLSNAKDKSQDRNANIKQLFQDLTILLRNEEEDEEVTPLTYEECMDAVAAGKKPTKAQLNSKTKTKEQKERTECLDQLEKFCEKCFPIKKSRPPPPEIIAFERDPSFDPHSKPKDPDTDGPSRKSDVYFDLTSTSEHFYSCSKSADSKSATLSRDPKLPDSEAPDANSRDPLSEPPDVLSSTSRAPSTISKGKNSPLQVSPGDSVKGLTEDANEITSQTGETQIAVEPKRVSGANLSESIPPKAGSVLGELMQPKVESEPDNSRGIEMSECRCESNAADELGALTDRERLLCEYIMRRMCAMCEGEEEDLVEQATEKGRPPPAEPCLCCHCQALVCDNQCKTVTKTLDAVRYDPIAETKFFIDSIICDMHAMEHVMTKNQIKPKRPKPSACMGNGPGESFPVTITDVSSLGCRALYVRWQLEDCTAIGGYEIYVDGHLTNRFYNFRHEAGVVANVDVTTGHQVILRAQVVGQEFDDDQPNCGKLAHPHPEMLVGASRPWTPSVYYYEP